ncbi:MAG: hypothetical protein HY042_00050 [Spirochaetia bacterium]|nr:hypothetical protein [Spirochaetia bacterium]
MLGRSAFLVLFFTGMVALHAEEKLCVADDFVRMRSQPDPSAPVVRDLFWLQQFATSEPVGVRVSIGSMSDVWHQVTYKICQPPYCSNTEVKGYVFGAFLKTCPAAVSDFEKRMASSLPLSQKLLGRALYGGERMAPGGQSTRRDNVTGGCCNHITYTTSRFTWAEKRGGVNFSVFYDFRVDEERTGTVQHDAFNGDCLVTGLVKGNGFYRVASSTANPFCSRLSISLSPVILGSSSDEEAPGQFR